MKIESQEALLVLLQEFGKLITHHSNEVVNITPEGKVGESDLIKLLNDLKPDELGYVLLAIQNLNAIIAWCESVTKGGETKTAIYAANMIQEWLHLGAKYYLENKIIEGPKSTQELILFVLDSCHVSPTLNKYEAMVKAEGLNNFFTNFNSDTIN